MAAVVREATDVACLQPPARADQAGKDLSCMIWFVDVIMQR
jgi:hypothetical protein